ncbi:MAG: type II toxin-antitoxin system RelE/ParE family toxin [Deltaproteobacteria bacterium]|nr:type II toxin-antitoxin system RelE/ParE family toxin [Deltaproteobacteria bacterium]
MQVVLHAGAAAEVSAAVSWYEEREPALGAAFLGELDRGLAVIAEAPYRWPVWPGARPELGARRFLLARFPYGIAYRVRGQRIIVLAVAHLHRRPGYWKVRQE